jgi:beta-galactosidase
LKNFNPQNWSTLLLSALCVIFISSCGLDKTNRINESFDKGWKFHRGVLSGAEASDFDISGWREVDLPHDWSIEDIPGTDSPFDTASVGARGTGYAVGGTGWYAKEFTLDKSYAGKRVNILFEGVYMNSDVWLNGHHLGNHPYGYTSFHYDISNYLHFDGSPNRLAVEVKNEGANCRWYSGSGISSHVWLTDTSLIHVKHWGT